MRLHVQDTIETGTALLDTGITDLEIAVINGQVHLYASTGRNGGLVHYSVDDTGHVQTETTVIFPPEVAGTVGDHMVIGWYEGNLTILLGSEAGGLYGFDLVPGGGLGPEEAIAWSVLQSAAAQGQFAAAKAMVLVGGTAPQSFPASFDCGQVTGMAEVTINGVTYVLTVCNVRNGVTSFAVDPATGALHEVDTMGASQGVGINAPTAMEVLEVGGQSFVIVAGSGTDSLTVMRMVPGGTLEPTDHILDNGSTRFEGVQSLAVAVSGDHAFVVAGGADSGISLFVLLPDGKLVHLQTIADSADLSLHSVSAITAVVDGDTLHVFVGSQRDSGVSQFTIDLSTLGDAITGTEAPETLTGGAGDDILTAIGAGDRLVGGAGDDILVTGDGQTDMSGGSGSDLFVIRDGSGATHVLDFERGVDTLDLSQLPMLRDLSQLTVTVTATGIVIDYRGHVIRVTASDGRPLTLSDVFPAGLVGGDRVPVEAIIDQSGILVEGTDGADLIGGTARNDTLNGSAGSDTISGGAGNDQIDGGTQHDVIDGGDGHDLLLGGSGRDTIQGGSGNDTIEGDIGKDLLLGGLGADLIRGGSEKDRLFGDDGNDLLYGDGGPDRLYGGNGNDLLDGGWGDDRLWGHGGDDGLMGGDGQDSLYAGSGNDTLDGGDGHDLLKGGSGRDLLYGGTGSDTLNGGAARDTIYGGDQRDMIYGEGGRDWLFGDAGDDLLYGQNGWDKLFGGAGNDLMWAGAGNDTLSGGDGNDWLSGQDGNDRLFGDAGDDTLRGGTGDDILVGGAGADVFEFYGSHGTGRIRDFSLAEGDRLLLDDAIWAVLGTLTPEEVVAQFGSLNTVGDVVLDFTDIGGCLIILGGFDDLVGLSDAIDFM